MLLLELLLLELLLRLLRLRAGLLLLLLLLLLLTPRLLPEYLGIPERLPSGLMRINRKSLSVMGSL